MAVSATVSMLNVATSRSKAACAPASSNLSSADHSAAARSAGAPFERARRRLAGQSRCLGGRQPLREVRSHRAHARLVVGGVEPVAARGAHRREERVAALPRAEEVGADARAPRELTDAKRGVCHAAEHSRWTNNEQGLDKVGCPCLAVHGLFSVCPSILTKGAP